MHTQRNGFKTLEMMKHIDRPTLGEGAGVVLMSSEDLLKIRKQAAYALLVLQPDFNPQNFKLECYGPVPGELFSNWLLSPKLTKYVESLVCRTCKGFARLKYTWCKVNLMFSQLCVQFACLPGNSVLQHQVPGGGEGGALSGVQGDPREEEGRGGAGGQGGGVSPGVGPGSLQ